MFYSQCLLSGKGPLGAIWVAAYFFKKLKKAQVTQTDIPSSIGSSTFLFTFSIYFQVCPLSFMLGLPFGETEREISAIFNFWIASVLCFFVTPLIFFCGSYTLLVVFELECGCGEETTEFSSSSSDFGFVWVLLSKM